MRDEDQAQRTVPAFEGATAEERRAADERRADRLREIIDAHGWPGPGLVGQEGSAAAWLISQHAVSRPELMRRCLALLEPLAEEGIAPRSEVALLLDRIRTLEGKPQIYGSQFVWNERGELVPQPIEDEAHVDERRAAAGLEPLADYGRRLREIHGARPTDPAGR